MKLFPGKCGTVYYSPYKSEQIKLQEPDGNAIYKRNKINAQGILYEHYEYSLAKLRRQNLLACQQMQDTIALPETTTGNYFGFFNTDLFFHILHLIKFSRGARKCC